jgi:deoxyribodipyrimidine photo-lyase
MRSKVNLFWFRRDLRLDDNIGLHHALSGGLPVLPIFIFDRGILDQLEEKKDRRVHYIHLALRDMHTRLQANGSGLLTFYSDVTDAFRQLTEQFDIQTVYANRDYEPAAMQRDQQIQAFLSSRQIGWRDFKDQVIFEKNDVLKDDRTPYTVFTPYARKWRAMLQPSDLAGGVADLDRFFKRETGPIPSLASIGFKETDMTFKPPTIDLATLKGYADRRDIPSLEATTNLGTALRFGTISLRHCVALALQHSDVWLSELIWREFFKQILFHFPKVVHTCFNARYELVQWRNDESEFERWCKGETGYPIVDAGMRQLNETGFMHNRVRMITASFLCKHLLIDWRWGEAYFAQKLNDYDLSANNGNWQWAAGCGCDAAPYFRVFNPTLQTQRFDKDLAYVKRWNPAYNNRPAMVEHAVARDRALKTYQAALQKMA